MRRGLLKLLIIFMFGLVFHDYFITQVDIVKKCDLIQDSPKHQALHLNTLEIEPFELSFIPFFEASLFEYQDLSSQFIYHLSPPPPKSFFL